MKYLKFTSFDGTVLQCYLWDAVKKPLGVVQISHGMAEHARRYDDFAKYLNGKGYIVFADDHRAHGHSEKKESVGYHDGDIFSDTVTDEVKITEYLKSTYSLPVVYLGHSYGSFIGQGYLERENSAAAVLLSGTADMDGAQVKMGKTLANLQFKTVGGRKTGYLINKLSFGAYDKPFKKENYKFAWLTRDKDIARKYYEDELCGYPMSIAFSKYMFEGLLSLYTAENLAKIDKSKRVAIFGGEKDPVGGKNSSLAKKLAKRYQDLGLTNVTIKTYPDARHEILNELNRAEVYADMLAVIDEATGVKR